MMMMMEHDKMTEFSVLLDLVYEGGSSREIFPPICMNKENGLCLHDAIQHNPMKPPSFHFDGG